MSEISLTERAYKEAERRVQRAIDEHDVSLDLSDILHLNKIPLLRGLNQLEQLELRGRPISDLAPISSLPRLRTLGLMKTHVSDLRPLAGVTSLRAIDLTATLVFDLSPLRKLTSLLILELAGTRVVELAALANLSSLRGLDLDGTRVTSLSPLSSLRHLCEGARTGAGLSFTNCPLSDRVLQGFANLPNPERTSRAINYLRKQQGLPSYEDTDGTEAQKVLSIVAPDALEGIPSPFDFRTTERGTITIIGSDTNLPVFPFATSREDHAQRLQACKVLTADLIKALSERRYDNVRSEYFSYLQRYLERLPQSAENGNMLLADGMARSLRKLFAADADMLPNAFAAELHTLLEYHIAACAYYPEIGAFNRDVRDGKPSRPFPLKAAEEFVKTVQAYTPLAFEPPVSRALSEAQTSAPPPPAVAADLPPPLPETIRPPQIPGGETDPKKSREFATASTANRLWKTVKIGAVVATAGRGLIDASQALAPHAKELIEWLASVIESLS